MEENGEVLSRIRGRGDEEITAKRRDQRVLVYKLFSCADHLDMVLMIVGTVSAVANGLSQPIMALLFGSAINTFNTSDSQHLVIHVSKLSLKLLYLAIGTSIAAFFQVWCWTVTGERQASRLRGLYLKAILRQEIGFFDTKTTTGDVVERMTECSLLIQDAMSEKVGRCIQLLSTFFGGFIVGFYKGMLLAFILLFGIPALAIIGLCVTIILSKISVRGQVVGSDAGNVVQETLHTIRMVASLSMEKQVSEKYKRKLEKAYGFTVQQGLVTGIGYGMVAFIVFSSYGLALWYGSKLIIEKGYTGGQVVSVLVAMVFGGMSLGQTSPSLNAITAGRAAAYKLFEAIERQPRIDPSDSNGIVLGDLNGELELRNVFFSYPARPDVPIFCGFSLRIPNGKTVALIGQNGSGKSTVISLLQRFYDPDAGEVLFDGIDLKKLRLRWVREKIGLVSQEPVFFAGTIRENLEYGKENATMEEIMEAIELANAAKFISELPQGLSTMVGERGIQLSGGQKQRIAIARVILKKPRVFLLDEATSALDVRSQTIVQGTLAKVMSNRTTLIIAHRLETINKADTIAFLHRGKLVKQGTHAELIKDTDGLYFQLVHSEDGAKNFENDGQMHMHDDESVHTGNKSQVSSKHSFSIHGSEIDGEERRERDEKNKEKCHRVIIKRLAKLHKPHLPILLLASIATSMHGLIFPIFGFLFSIAIKTFYEPPNKLEKDSKFWALMYMGLGIIDLVAMTLQNYLFGVAGAKLVQSIRSLSFQKVVHQEMCWFDEPANSSCAIAARISTNALVLQSISRDALALIVQNMATVIAGLLIALVASWRLALIFLALSSAVGLQSFIQPKFLKRFTTNENTMYEEACQVASDAVSNIRTIASFCAESKVMDLYQQKCNNHVRRKTWIGFIRGTGFGFSFFAFYFTNALCFYIGAILVQSRKATTEEVFKVYLALMVSAIGMSEASGIASDTSKAIDCVVSIFNILDSKPKIDSSSSEGMEPANAAGDIEFQNVNFGYPSRPSIKIFNGLCLSIPSGTTVALVGESGSGKSTVISLLQRFYDPYSGHITMGGIDIRKLKLCWLRLQMGLVSQEPILFNETIRANVAYGRQGDATEDEIIAATKAANAHDFISALPQGYDTTVGECGAQLSGGQKQRLAIARAIVRDPKILLLDEATSALDKGCERVVQEALDRVSAGRTTMVITHRLATIRDVDMIAVIKNGMVFEKGRHDELVSMPHGAYAALFETSSA